MEIQPDSILARKTILKSFLIFIVLYSILFTITPRDIGIYCVYLELRLMEILKHLVTPKEANAAYNLMKDDDCKLMILKSMGQKLLQKDEIFIIDSTGQFMLLIANAPFLRSDEECLQISNIVQWGIKTVDILPLVTEHQKKDLAYRCLLSLGLFRSALERRTQRYGAPSAQYYREVGIQEFKNIGFLEISEDFQKWECYLSEIAC